MRQETQYLNELELLAPAKTADIGIEAINHGADAVYIGGPIFSARVNASNTLEDIERLCNHAHRFRSRVYLALNTIFTDEELVVAHKLAHQAWNIGVDALIVQDMGLLQCDLPPIQLHASTQCDIRTPQKAKFLEAVGFSQIVPARELSLEQIQAISNELTTARIEFFIHGALCVSYSGQCYASQAIKGRSANRGNCAQLCRLPYDLFDENGLQLKKNCHALSLKDNNQSSNLESLIRAGVRSFKIEGRYKDISYVKNTTAFYRQRLDDYLTRNPDFHSSSVGYTEVTFEPDPNRTFNRGVTDYFVHGRGHSDITSFDTPKNAGIPAGKVLKVQDQSFLLQSNLELHNGDGLAFYQDDGVLNGLLINRAENQGKGVWSIFLREPTKNIPQLRPGLKLMRNRDNAWMRLMEKDTAQRFVPIKIKAQINANRITLKALDEEGNCAQVNKKLPLQKAQNTNKAIVSVQNSLKKLGGTIYRTTKIELEWDSVRFIPISEINELRRLLVKTLDEVRKSTYRRPQASSIDPSVVYPQSEIDYRGNVLNSKSKDFYLKHHCIVTEPAIEGKAVSREIELMRCKHCIRFSLGLCPKEGAKQGKKIKPTPLKLISDDIELEARFHCKPCEMSIVGKIVKK
ncbi:MAG: U32 family peptidase [Burkholderiaceae bacterium]|nr:U32 family peptidase [Burkholderiaceae bacterium]